MAELFELPNPDDKPMAEIWMGAHPKASSEIVVEGEHLSLEDFIERYKGQALGELEYQRYEKLPYLFKVLSASKSLSIQVHPSKHQAEVGFARENSEGVSLGAPERQYQDSNHKPEIIYALTKFKGMNGFRPYGEVMELLVDLESSALDVPLQQYAKACDAQGLRELFKTVLSFEGEKKRALIAAVSEWAGRTPNALGEVVSALLEQYPGDIGAVAPFMLNVVELNPGEAMFIDAGTPHAYLGGTGLEVMASSDNVLRAGLTPKHIDIDELMACSKFTELNSHELLIKPVQTSEELLFPVPVSDFRFSVLDSPSGDTFELNSAEIWFAIDKDATLTDSRGQELRISKGQSVFIPAMASKVHVMSQGRIARVKS
ncbi:mannose-6-phosphate isomerase [Vibrio ishigakensis]|uniref:mannose-6-phosphate isomerase n=1 Tax=Vibrio ishigakensis TaxID=1481914 RepID=A0A0B8QJZ2_9VIBR|nr:mannose-6-phosphate isomerase [Vibrio ishigakensis]